MREADIARKHKNLVYVQALKLLQTASGQAGARKQVATREPCRAAAGRRPSGAPPEEQTARARQELMQAG